MNNTAPSTWKEFRPSSWYRSDMAGASQPHDDLDQPCADYWLGWPPYITGEKSDIGHPAQVMKRRFKTREAAMAYVDKTWPLSSEEKMRTQKGMSMTANLLEIESYAIALGQGEGDKPVCLIISADSLDAGGAIALTAVEAQLVDGDLVLHSEVGQLVLKSLGDAFRQAVILKLPLVVLDPASETEHLVPIAFEGAPSDE